MKFEASKTSNCNFALLGSFTFVLLLVFFQMIIVGNQNLHLLFCASSFYFRAFSLSFVLFDFENFNGRKDVNLVIGVSFGRAVIPSK